MKKSKKEEKKKKKGKGIAALKEGITGNDPVTIVVPGETEDENRQGLVCDRLGHYLHDEMEVPFGQIVVLITNNSDVELSDAQKQSATGTFLSTNCRIAEHDADAPMIPLGTLRDGTEVSADPLVVGRKVITIGETIGDIFSNANRGGASLDRKEWDEAENLLSSVFTIELA